MRNKATAICHEVRRSIQLSCSSHQRELRRCEEKLWLTCLIRWSCESDRRCRNWGRLGRKITTRFVNEVVKMFGKDAEIGCEYVVPVAVGYYFSYDRLVNLYNSDRSTAVGVLVMNIDDYRSVLNLVVYNGRNAP